MNKITIHGSWGNLLFTGYTIVINSRNIKIKYGNYKNYIYLTYPYQKETNFSLFNKFIETEKEKYEYDFINDGSDFKLYYNKEYKYNLSLYKDLEDDLFDILKSCLGFDFSEVAIKKWEAIIKDGFNQNRVEIFHD